jgi:hypothetical protein
VADRKALLMSAPQTCNGRARNSARPAMLICKSGNRTVMNSF